MTEETQNHLDCDQFQVIDVFKGFCRRQKLIIPIDERSCEHFHAAPKCGICAHFTPISPKLGNCMGKALAYPDMLAKTCPDFLPL